MTLWLVLAQRIFLLWLWFVLLLVTLSAYRIVKRFQTFFERSTQTYELDRMWDLEKVTTTFSKDQQL